MRPKTGVTRRGFVAAGAAVQAEAGAASEVAVEIEASAASRAN